MKNQHQSHAFPLISPLHLFFRYSASNFRKSLTQNTAQEFNAILLDHMNIFGARVKNV